MRRSLIYLLPLALFLGLGLALYRGLSLDDALPSALIDQPVPVFDLPGLTDGDPRFANTDLADGKVSLINIFASWCVPCRVEHPMLKEISDSDAARVFGINYKDDPAKVRAWFAREGNPYARIGRDDTGRTGIDFGVYGVPETYVIDGDGRIRYRHVGPLRQKDIDQTILPLVRGLSR